MSIIDRQQTLADELLEAMYLIDTNCVIAGGAPRDWYLGQGAKDIDLFFNPKSGLTQGQLDTMLGLVGIHGYTFLDSKSLKHYNSNPSLVSVREYEKYGVSVQLVQIIESDYKCCINNFPLNLCKFWYKDGKISVHRDAALGLKHKALIKLVDNYKNDKYISKIKSRFPDYSYWESFDSFKDNLIYKDLENYE